MTSTQCSFMASQQASQGGLPQKRGALSEMLKSESELRQDRLLPDGLGRASRGRRCGWRLRAILPDNPKPVPEPCFNRDSARSTRRRSTHWRSTRLRLAALRARPGRAPRALRGPLDHFLQKNAKNIQKYANKCAQYAKNMQKYANKSAQYAKKCKKYAKNMQKICKNICIVCTTNIYRGPIQYAALSICKKLQKNAKKMQKMQFVQTMAPICKICTRESGRDIPDGAAVTDSSSMPAMGTVVHHAA